MTDSDLFAFNEVFQSVIRVFPLRGEDHEIRDVMASYFKALRRFPIDLVRAGGEQCCARLKRMPKPIEWIELIPKATVKRELPQLTPSETAEYLRAERLRYDESDPCKCSCCRSAGVDHRFPRFVPEFDEDDREVRALIGEREIVRGHWAHGEELKRWYAAKDAFWDKFRAMAAQKSMR